MPVVKLISNPNRSTNPYKGQFLNQIFNHDSEILKGRLGVYFYLLSTINRLR